MVDIIDVMEYFEDKTADGLIFNAIKQEDTREYIVGLNLSQLREFKDSKDQFLSDIGGEYSGVTQELKNVGPREVDLFDTGSYYKSFEANPLSGSAYQIVSDPIKEGRSLEDRYGDNLEGLNKRNLKLADDFIEGKVFEIAESSL